MSFNIKKDKKKKKEKIIIKSLEQLHEEKVLYLSKLRDSLPKKIKELNEHIKKNPDEKHEYQIIKNKIKDIEQRKEENEYYLNVNYILHQYFEIENSDSSRRQELIKEYYDACNLDYICQYKKNEQAYCDLCENSELKVCSEKFLTCTSCGKVFSSIIDGYSYNDMVESDIVYPFVYKRINYFTEMIQQMQGIQHVEIPEELLNDLKTELRKRKINDSSKIKPPLMKRILKEINQFKYYEHVHLLITKLCGTKSLVIPEKVCEKLKRMFLDIQKPYEDVKGERKSFLSYPYVFYKFFELLDLREYLEYFQLLKSREKLMKQEVIWIKIIEILSKTDSMWKFIPSC